jgi:hypothetical protein
MESKISARLAVECCRAMMGRDRNAGTWPGGKVPDCIREVARLYGVQDEAQAVRYAEGFVKSAAVEMVAEFVWDDEIKDDRREGSRVAGDAPFSEGEIVKLKSGMGVSSHYSGRRVRLKRYGDNRWTAIDAKSGKVLYDSLPDDQFYR